MKCEELLKAMNDYVEGEIDPAVCQEFEQHLAGCNPCQIVIDNIRQTIALYRSGQPYPMPPEFHQQLRRCLFARWQEKFGSRPGAGSGRVVE
jgi:anti-sigma factor RsiW